MGKFGVDWEFVEQQSRIVDIKHARRFPSKEKFKINDADKRGMKKLKVTKLSISKQPGICITRSLYAPNVEAKMFKEEDSGSSQVKRIASSKRNTSDFRSSYFLRTSTDVVTHLETDQETWSVRFPHDTKLISVWESNYWFRKSMH